MKLIIPGVRLVSALNAREHWAKRYRRNAGQRDTVMKYVLALKTQGQVPKGPPWLVRITRIGKRWMDGDNLQGACKSVRDAIAKVLGVDDGTDDVRWEYAQRMESKYAVEIVVLKARKGHD